MIAAPETITDARNWYAVYARSRHEKTVARLLEERRVEAFLPLIRVLSQWADRKKWIEKPCFPGYLFVRVAPEDFLTVYGVRGVVRIVGTEPYRPTVVPGREIENVRRLVESRVRIDPYPYLKPGQSVYVKRGPLRGVEGVLVKKAKTYLLVISVNLLGRSVMAEVSAECVQGL